MLELFGSIGVLGVGMLVVGFGLLWWLSKIIENTNPFDDEGDTDE